MATAFILPHCSVCKQASKYGASVPYLLPCLHSICNECLNHLGTVISCSHCGESFSKEEYIFLKDTVTQHEIFRSTVKNSPSQIKCTNKTHKNAAIVWCKDCQIFFCKSCQVSHRQLKSSDAHEMVMVSDLASRATVTKQSHCPEHESYVLDLYDLTCEVLICSKCARTDHKQCQNEEVTAAARDDRDILLREQKKLKEKLQDVITTLEDTNKSQKDIETRKENMKRGLAYRFDSLRALITKQERELMQSLDQRHKSINDEIKRVTTRLEQSGERVQVAHDFTKMLLTQNDPEDFLMLKNNVKSRVQICLAEEIEKLDVAGVTVIFSKEKLDEFKKLISSIGEIELMEGTDLDNTSIYENIELDMEKNIEPELADPKDTTQVNKAPSQEASCPPKQASLQAKNDSIYENTDADTNRVIGNPEEGDDLIYTDCSNLKDPPCPMLIFDVERVNTKKVHISNEGYLINTEIPTGKIFTHYVGTTTVTPLAKGELSYWEVETDVQIDKQMKTYGILMEIGVVEGDDTEMPYCASGKSNSRCLTITHCDNHKGICAKLWKNGLKVECKEDVIFNKAGELYTLKHGVLYDGVTNNLVFIDLNQMKLMKGLNSVKSTSEIWPIFGVYNPALAAVKMRLVSGTDVELTKEKLSLLEAINLGSVV